jgi:hypothetical protein
MKLRGFGALQHEGTGRLLRSGRAWSRELYFKFPCSLLSKQVSLLGKFPDVGPDRDKHHQSLRDTRAKDLSGIDDHQVTVWRHRERIDNVSARQEEVMPAIGDNPDIACYTDRRHDHTRARSDETWGRENKRWSGRTDGDKRRSPNE